MLRRFLAASLLLVALPASWAHGSPHIHRSATEAVAAAGQNARVTSGRAFFGDTRYAGSDSCKSCHEDEYRTWKASWHSKMEQWPSEQTVIGDFADRRIQLRKLRVRAADGTQQTIDPVVRLFREGGRFLFTLIDQDDAANNQTWPIAKVLGGKWDQGYEVQLASGHYYPAPIRWNEQVKDWIVGGFNPQDWYVADGTPDGRPMKPAELPAGRVAEAKCNGCHTTGFSYAKGADGRWAGRMHGQGEIAIACEACHGPGARHVDEARAAKDAGRKLQTGQVAIVNPLTDLNAEQSTQVCGQCHGRGGHKLTPELAFPTGFLPGDTELLSGFRLWSFSGTNNKDESDYFWRNDWASRNRQQLQDFLKSGHYTKAGMSCVSCHTFHGKPEGAQLRAKPEQLCAQCHRADGRAMKPNAEMFAGSTKDEAGVGCVDCHMARLGSRSRATSRSGHLWDTSTHTFKIATPQMEQALGVRSSCTGCHVDGVVKPGAGKVDHVSPLQELADGMRQRADEVRKGVAETQAMLAKVDAKKPAAAALAEQARAKLGFIVADNSKGAHNMSRTRQLLAEARALALRALGTR